MKKDTFGIDMKKWCREHETAVEAAISEHGEGAVLIADVLEEHREKIQILQHERLVHLIVTAMSVIVELFAVYLVLIHPDLGIGPAMFMLAFAVLLGFYFRYYFLLENTVQRWYRLEDELERLKGKRN